MEGQRKERGSQSLHVLIMSDLYLKILENQLGNMTKNIEKMGEMQTEVHLELVYPIFSSSLSSGTPPRGLQQVSRRSSGEPGTGPPSSSQKRGQVQRQLNVPRAVARVARSLLGLRLQLVVHTCRCGSPRRSDTVTATFCCGQE